MIFQIKRYRDNAETTNWFCCPDHQYEFQKGRPHPNPRPATTWLTLVCGHCCKEFGCWEAAERKYCSPECSTAAGKTGVVTKCRLCDKEFYKVPQQMHDFCCKEHWSEWRVLNRPKANCEVCGQEFRKPGPSSKAKFCSYECRMVDATNRCPAMLNKQVGSTAPNKLEEAGYAAMERAGLDFERQYFLDGRFTVDAALVPQKIIVQFDSDYWHGNRDVFPELSPRQLRQRAIDHCQNDYCRQQGWTVVRVWESELHRDPVEFITRIRKKEV